MATPLRRSDPRHIIATTRTFFVTSSTWGKRPLLQSSRSAELFIAVLYEYRNARKYWLHEFVVMPDHFHLLLTVGADISIEKAVQLVKGGYSYRAAKEFGTKSPVWQKGFSEVRILDTPAFNARQRYIWENPVVRHLAKTPEEYPYSSANQRFSTDPPPQGLKPLSERPVSGTAEAVP